MEPGWVDPLAFTTICLVGGGVLLSLWIGFRPSHRTLAGATMEVLIALVALAAGLFAIAALIGGQSLALWGSAATLLALYFLLLVVPSPGFGRCVAACIGLARQRRGRFAAMLGLWTFCPFFALYLVSLQLNPPESLSSEELAGMVAGFDTDPPPEPNEASPLTTDRGRTITTFNVRAGQSIPKQLASQPRLLTRWQLNAEVICVPLAWQNTNCHGFVFTGGRYWIGGAQVDWILEDNGYLPVTQARPGDVAVYRDRAGQIVHTGIVRGLAADGVILVESKWGKLDRFIHRHDRHPYSDCDCTYFRSPRPDHLLLGSASGISEPTTPAIPVVTRTAGTVNAPQPDDAP